MVIDGKICTKCKQWKSLEEFGWSDKAKGKYKSQCKVCLAIYAATPKAKAARTAYANLPKSKATRAVQKSAKSKYDKLRSQIPEIKEIINRQRRQRRLTDIQYRLECNLRSRLNMARRSNYKSGSAVRDLGCSMSELKQYIESQFQPGMTWENYGNKVSQWSMDHKIAISKFDLTKREELLKACHYTNLQPMWHVDNVRKGVR